MRRVAEAAIAAAIGLVMFGARADAQNINVVINGQPVAFSGTPPQEVNSSVLVPLRGVFEQLGASVQYNPSTKTIFAQKGTTTVSLSLGSSTAYVDNQTQQLAQPPTVILGTTLVPLRFVAESFGAYVEWQPQTQTVQIQTSPSSAVAIAPPPPPESHQYQGSPPTNGPQTSTVSGLITDIDDPENPQAFTVSTPGGPVQVTLDEHSRIEIKQSDSDTHPGQPTFLRRGDAVTVHTWPNGNVRSVEDSFDGFKGRIVAILVRPGSDIAVVLDDGQTLEIDGRATIYHVGSFHQAQLTNGDTIFARKHPHGKHVYTVDIF